MVPVLEKRLLEAAKREDDEALRRAQKELTMKMHFVDYIESIERDAEAASNYIAEYQRLREE